MYEAMRMGLCGLGREECSRVVLTMTYNEEVVAGKRPINST